MCAATIGGAGRTKQERAPSDFGFVTTDFWYEIKETKVCWANVLLFVLLAGQRAV